MYSHVAASFHQPGSDGPRLDAEKPGRVLRVKTQKLHEHQGLPLGTRKPRDCGQDSDPIVNRREVLVVRRAQCETSTGSHQESSDPLSVEV
jgi:hypothetical protein